MCAYASLNYRFLILEILMLMILNGCRINTSPRGTILPTPENACKASTADWQGIIPGQSTKVDVIASLGEPSEKGHLSKWNQDYFLYPPILTIVDSYGNQIVFDSDELVDWIDIWVSNSDGRFYTLAEAVQEYGPILDTVYVNGGFDMFGPDHVYVWSECGIAISAVDAAFIKKTPDEILSLTERSQIENSELTFRYPVPPDIPVQPKPDVNQIIVRKFIFQPTNFDAFNTLYRDKIRHLGDNRLYRLK